MNRLWLALVLAALPLAPLSAEEAKKDEKKPEAPVDRESVTQHAVTIGGQRFEYTAKAGTLVLENEAGEAQASIFYIAYLKKGVPDSAKRPLTFSFNGGPGSASVWLHLGTLGPRRVVMDDEGHALPPPYRLEDNAYSLLDVSDLVFIDPVSTGYSRPAPGKEEKEFHGLDEDIQAVGQFVRRWVSRNQRWDSPKFLIGESYGTTRASALVDHLQQRHGMFFNGVMLVSSILNFGTARFDVGNDLPYPLFLPTYTATAWFHGKLPADLAGSLQAALDESRDFALGDYWSALAKGDRLSDEERGKTVEKLARLTGLSKEFLERANLRPEIFRFTKELLRTDGKTVGRLDSRFTGFDRDDAGERPEFDPSYAAIQGPYTGTLNAYVRGELGFESDLDYEILGGRIRRWSYDDFENRYVNVAENLRAAMAKNPSLRVHVANGYYDLATPFFATEYTFDHLGLPAGLVGNVSMSYYEAGHMMYIRKVELVRLKENLATFIRQSAGG
jgi:carboxypeptidase C (cathepsin A)